MILIDIVNFPFSDGDHLTGFIYLIRFARVASHVADFNTRNNLTAKLLKHGYRYHNLLKDFSKFYRLHYDLVSI